MNMTQNKKNILLYLVFLMIGVIIGFHLATQKLTKEMFAQLKQNQITNSDQFNINHRGYKISNEIELFIKSLNQIVVDVREFGLGFIYVQTIGEGCASCHAKWIYIFNKKNKKLFETTSDDNFFGFSTDDTFSIIEPVRKENEPLCCPTEYKTRVFKSDGKTFFEIK